jgi:pimeloyl-ACP methyl ester carboxylesterase
MRCTRHSASAASPCSIHRVFSPMSPGYLAHAVPAVLRPSGARMLLLRWETRGAPLDEGWLRVVRPAADIPRRRPVVGPRPSPVRLRALSTPTLVLLPERSRVHDIDAVAAAVRADLANSTTMRLRGVSHHSVPTEQAAATAAALRSFLV